MFSLPNALHLGASHKNSSAEQGVDVIVHPSAIQTAPRLPDGSEEASSNASSLDAYVQDVLTVPASLAGLPALSVPAGQGSDGWPIGVSVVGQWGCDAMVLMVAPPFQRQTP